jgi:L-alanine-DL-glutamate epimerase-like enolase superfamily enzyme
MIPIEDVRIREVIRPLRTPFSTSLGRKDLLRSIIVSVRLEGGASGTGEVPTSIAFKAEDIAVIRRVLAEAAKAIRGSSIEDYGELVVRLRIAHPSAFMTISGLEVALFRAFLASRSIRESSYWGERCSRIETDITIPFLTDEQSLGRWIDWTISRGFKAYKLKVSGKVEQDMVILSYLHRALVERVPRFRLRLDGNQGYTTATFRTMVRRLEGSAMAIELFEQPLPKDDLRGYEKIRAYGSVPVILDETILSASDARRAIENNLCDGMNVKIAKSGLAESMKIAALAREHKKKLMIGSMIETMTGLSAAIFLAAGTGYFDYIDLDGAHFLYGKPTYPDITAQGPVFTIARG